MKRFRDGLAFKAHRHLYHSTLGSRVIKKKRRESVDPSETELGHRDAQELFEMQSDGKGAWESTGVPRS